MRWQLCSAADTERAGAALASVLPAAGVVYLHGELGAGKTTLARGLLRALGVVGAIRSPSYSLLEPYALTGRELLHMDLYRLSDPADVFELGLDDYPPERWLWLVEWPEHGVGELPQALVQLWLAHNGEQRLLWLEAPAALLQQTAQALRAAGLLEV